MRLRDLDLRNPDRVTVIGLIAVVLGAFAAFGAVLSLITFPMQVASFERAGVPFPPPVPGFGRMFEVFRYMKPLAIAQGLLGLMAAAAGLAFLLRLRPGRVLLELVVWVSLAGTAAYGGWFAWTVQSLDPAAFAGRSGGSLPVFAAAVFALMKVMSVGSVVFMVALHGAVIVVLHSAPVRAAFRPVGHGGPA